MAHRSIDDLINEARSLLHDRDTANIRYSDATLVAALNMALDTLYVARPDAFIALFATGVPHFTDADLAEDFPLDGIFFSPCVLFVTGWAELREEEYAADGRAATFLSTARDTFKRG